MARYMSSEDGKLTQEIAKIHDKVKKKSTIGLSENGAYQDELLEAINSVTVWHKWRCNAPRTSAIIAKALWNHEVFHTHLLNLVRKYFWDTVFTPACKQHLTRDGFGGRNRVVRRDRCNTSSWNMWCQEILRVHHSIQVGDKANGKYCWMVCNSALSISIETKDKRQVHWIWLCKGNGLNNKSILLGQNWEDKGLSVASSIDGAFLSKNLSIVAGGIKTDLATQCPLNKRPLLDNPATMCV